MVCMVVGGGMLATWWTSKGGRRYRLVSHRERYGLFCEKWTSKEKFHFLFSRKQAYRFNERENYGK